MPNKLKNLVEFGLNPGPLVQGIGGCPSKQNRKTSRGLVMWHHWPHQSLVNMNQDVTGSNPCFFPLQVSSNGRGLLDVSRASRVHGVRPSEDVQGLRLLRNGLPGGLNV